MFLNDFARHARVVTHRIDLEPVADDAGRCQQLLQRGVPHGRDTGDVEAMVGLAIRLAPRQNGAPGQSGLGTLQCQQLEQCTIVVMRHAPLVVVVGLHCRIAAFRPGTADQRHAKPTTLPLPSREGVGGGGGGGTKSPAHQAVVTLTSAASRRPGAASRRPSARSCSRPASPRYSSVYAAV